MESQTEDLLPSSPVIGIVGSAGAYGRWLSDFFTRRMHLQVVGRDPTDPDSLSEAALIEQSDVLLFSAPIRHTPALIRQYTQLAAGRERGKLWLDVTSVKAEPVAAMLESQAEVAGLHPMTAPPKSPTLKGRVLVVCEARLDRWRPWVQDLLRHLQAECVHSTPSHHDQVMALVQAMVHASHLAQAGVLRDYAPQLGGLEQLMPFRSASFELDMAMTARILSLNPAIYEDIQFGNPHVEEMLLRLRDQLTRLHGLVSQGGDQARSAFRGEFLDQNRRVLGEPALQEGNYRFERVGYLLADLTETRTLSVHLPQDHAGSLRALLHVFERHEVSLSSIHSSRTAAGEVHFRIGFETGSDPQRMLEAALEVESSGIGRVLDPGA